MDLGTKYKTAKKYAARGNSANSTSRICSSTRNEWMVKLTKKFKYRFEIGKRQKSLEDPSSLIVNKIVSSINHDSSFHPSIPACPSRCASSAESQISPPCRCCWLRCRPRFWPPSPREGRSHWNTQDSFNFPPIPSNCLTTFYYIFIRNIGCIVVLVLARKE